MLVLAEGTFTVWCEVVRLNSLSISLTHDTKCDKLARGKIIYDNSSEDNVFIYALQVLRA
jgi:hypothetical protein